ncbi:hypothetical protein, conserved [Trypanosoma brucei gambiense DAL972]|uniref:Uncharacterized protein n=2 Tax=Trypanosoma brucei TaxID=5691 RepID=C9ZIL4_TRYB9|nr:hypothetical protein, conserved [Trypanosoma brucei gambiense DAL972]RHW74468.1 hypothetical protein DPX39_010030900 [Trypanosoma brucei equiperdum]CBH09006.1 hypothetical protein, conserved [Trypanosoma brucei gambiense DAL972]|eukprot:XP_011771447.1 hypothetical protein, conserved [Trypanosoma brucei gambiense DAL972]
MKHVSEMFIPGMTLSHLVSPLLSMPTATNRFYALYGHYSVREGDSDATESSLIVEAVVRVVLPLHAAPPEETKFIGFASVKKSSPHKLSYEETRLLRGDTEPAESFLQKSDRSYPMLLLLVTTPLEVPVAKSTKKVEYSVFECKTGSADFSEKVIPLKVDNMVDSFSAFVRLSNLGSHALVRKQSSPPTQSSPSANELSFQSSISQLEVASAKRQTLLKRLTEVERLLERKQTGMLRADEQKPNRI